MGKMGKPNYGRGGYRIYPFSDNGTDIYTITIKTHKVMKYNSELYREYAKICDKYIKAFEEKQDLDFEFWVGYDIGGVAAFEGDYYFSFENIIIDIERNAPTRKILEYHDTTCNDHYPRYEHWLMGCPTPTAIKGAWHNLEDALNSLDDEQRDN